MTGTADIHNTQAPEQKVPTLSSSQLPSLEIPANFKMKAGTRIYITKVLCVICSEDITTYSLHAVQGPSAYLTSNIKTYTSENSKDFMLDVHSGLYQTLMAQTSTHSLTFTQLTPMWHRGNRSDCTLSSFLSRAARLLPSKEALGEGGELAFPVFNEVALGHEVVELLSLLWHHHPRILLHAEPQTCAAEEGGRVASGIFALSSMTRCGIRLTSPNFR